MSRLLFCMGIVFLCSQFIINKIGAEEFQFIGEHLLVNYIDCDNERLRDHKAIFSVIKEAIAHSGATFLTASEHDFFPQGYSAVVLLSESHVSIHTYPEHSSCFIDFFTCGTSCSSEIFEKYLNEYLQPKKIIKKIFIRGDTILEKNQ